MKCVKLTASFVDDQPTLSASKHKMTLFWIGPPSKLEASSKLIGPNSSQSHRGGTNPPPKNVWMTTTSLFGRGVSPKWESPPRCFPQKFPPPKVQAARACPPLQSPGCSVAMRCSWDLLPCQPCGCRCEVWGVFSVSVMFSAWLVKLPVIDTTRIDNETTKQHDLNFLDVNCLPSSSSSSSSSSSNAHFVMTKNETMSSDDTVDASEPG